ncbi:protein ROS1-like [Phalaenopsis equestris]|uniref:protein ROS1-like n=1 Tax=Phalaenopsis equestris TaxID=78828 RepID=UPI0009E4861A|nr:protein ROS1-like [Phalaenopsis equestris]XP_020593889.1 protein ROS1-like [Phalaenopsis equestris]
MDFSGGPPLKKHQDFGIPDLWSPVTPVKNIPTRRQLISSPCYSQRNQIPKPSWLDLVSGVQAATPPWGLSFQNGVCSTPGIPNYLQALNGSQAVEEASASQATISSHLPHSATVNNDNAVLMNHCPLKLGKIRPLTPFFENVGNCQVLPASSNQLLLNGKVLLPHGCYNRSSNCAVQKTQYGSTVTRLPNLNSFQNSSMSFAGTGEMPNLLNHMNPEIYNERMQYTQQSLDVTNLVDEHVREQNLMVNVSANASFSNLLMSSELASFQNTDCIKNLAVPADEISNQLTAIEKSLVERENERTDLDDDASKQKPKRKKHRPKVIIEGKPSRTPKLVTPKLKTPMAAGDKKNALGKRKYTRRKKDTMLCLDANALGEIVDAESRSGSKSVRRSLNFDLEESQSDDKFSYLMSMFMQNLEKHEQETCRDSNLASSGLKETLDSTAVQGPIVENSLSGIVFDLTSVTSEPQNEYLKILQTSSSITSNQNVVPADNIVNYNHVIDTPSKGTKRDLCHRDASWGLAGENLIYNNARDFSRQNHDTEKQGPCLPDNNKRRRMENGCTASICNPSPTLTFTPSTGWTIHTSNNSQELTFTDTMKFMAQKQLQTLEHVLLLGETDVDTHNHPVARNNLSSLIELLDYKRNATPVGPSLQKNNCLRQPSATNKPSGYSDSQESKVCGTLVKFEASEDVNKPMKIKGRRGRKKKEANPLIHPSPSKSSSGASHGQVNPGIIATTSTHLHDKNLHPVVISFDHQDKSSYKASTNSKTPSSSFCMEQMDYIVQKLRWLSIDKEHEVICSQAQNAIVPFVRNGGAMVPYEGTFEQVKRHRSRAKVDLDPETNRVWKLLMGIEGEGNEGANVDKEIWWEDERRVFQGRVDSFIARMHLVQGDRRFSQWKGSVVDSVIGVFLTQNVSDHLSSSAFMALAAKFPLRSRGNSRYSKVEKASAPRDNQTECITSLADAPNLQRNILNHDFCSQASLEINATANDGKSENSNSNETSGSGTTNNSGVYYDGKILESHETEPNIGQESPNSGSNTVVTQARSANSVDIEDRRFVEQVVSSQNSGVSSQNSMGCQVQSTDNIRSISTLNIAADDLQIANFNNGFGHSSFTELLRIAESNNFQEMYSHSSMPSANIQAVHNIGNNLPVFDYMDNSTVSTGLSESEAEFLYSHNTSNFTILENNASTLKEEIRFSLQSTTCEIARENKFGVTYGECKEPAAEAETDSLDKLFLNSGTANTIESYVPTRIESSVQSSFSETDVVLSQQSFSHKILAQRTDASSNIENSHGNTNIPSKDMAGPQQKVGHSTIKLEISQEAIRLESQMENNTNLKTSSTSNDIVQKLDVDQTTGSIMKDSAYNFQNVSTETPKQTEKTRKRKAEVEKKTFDWDSLRKEVNRNKSTEERSSDRMDSLDWEAVRRADVSEIAETIRERGMNNMLAARIKDFLDRLVQEHGSIDLEWLRDVPPDKSKDFLLSIRGLGLKSAECVRLLTLHHLAFPVDTNVGRICVRLGWVPLQPLPESLQLHLLELYPVLETIQKYLWPRLCKLDQRTLYELHYQMITFGKVFCTKSKPNCNACPMRGECRHFASAFASARLALPAPEDKSIVSSTNPIASEHGMTPSFTPSSIPQIECSSLSQEPTIQKNNEPIIEEPATPEPECPESLEREIEDAFFEDPDEIPTIKLNFEKFTQNLQNYMQENTELQTTDMSKALVALTPEAASIPMPRLKNISRLRTEHQVYEIPDSHPLLEELEQREPDDPCPYLLTIWTPGETAQSTEPPKACCDSQDTGQLCDRSTCFACSSIRESQAHKVRGTLLIPCRTAMRGSFPLNGTYFQVNEVFADHHTSRNPIDIPRDWIWNLPRRTVCFGTSIPTIFRGLTTEGIQQCFWRGFVCVRGFDRVTRAPKPLYARLHFPASKAPKNSKGGVPAAPADG